MAKKSSDITKTGPATYRDLQNLNNSALEGNSDFDFAKEFGLNSLIPISQYDARLHAQQDIATPIASQKTRIGNQDYWGNSFFDTKTATDEEFSRLNDIRAENQPWYSKLVNGIGKAGVLAATTALETAGLIYGLGQGVANVINDAHGESLGAGSEFLEGLWNNPITRALQTINEYSEEYMPNYYTQDEQENPWGNIFTANFLGDKILKNLGFMVGAFYGGIPASKAIGAVGKNAVKRARNRAGAEWAGMARRTEELATQYGDDVAGLNKALKAEGLTDAEKAARFQKGLDNVRNIAQTTRATSMAVGTLGSAINEGAIEAINNSKDWAENEKREALDKHNQIIAEIQNTLGETEEGTAALVKEAERYNLELQEIEKGRARVGNADLLLNIPILTATNWFELGRLYSRGFDSTRRQVGSWFTGHKLRGKQGEWATARTKKKGLMSAIAKSNAEGMEEYFQRAASEGSGNTVSGQIEEVLDRFMNVGKSEESKTNTDDYIMGFAKALADQLDDPNAWEEYFIGALSSTLGMPVFGSQTKNAYGFMKDNGVFGFAGGLYGEYENYTNKMDREQKLAEYLNNRVKDPKFKALYDNLRKRDDYDALLEDALLDEDKRRYKDIEFEKLFEDINAFASAGLLGEFKALVNYNGDYSDEELEDIIKTTSKITTADEKKAADMEKLEKLQEKLKAAEDLDGRKNIKARIEKIQKRIDENNYETKVEGPFWEINEGKATLSEQGRKEAISILDRNKENLNDAIDNYLRIRNEVDIETDGNLKDDQINFLTMLKAKIVDWDVRSADMTEDLINHLKPAHDRAVKELDEINDRLEQAQMMYDQALALKVDDKTTQEDINKARRKTKEAVDQIKKMQTAQKNKIDLLSLFTDEQETTVGERIAERKGYGQNRLRRLAGIFTPQSRNINYEEAQARLRNPINMGSLLNAILSDKEFDDNTKQKLIEEAYDLHEIATDKLKYNDKIREYLDPDKINDAFKKAEDKMTQKEIDNKSDDLALRIKGAKNMSELDKIIRESSAASEVITREAIKKVKEEADDSVKNFIVEYEKARGLYTDVIKMVNKLSDPVRSALIGIVQDAWEYALTQPNVYNTLLDRLSTAADDMLSYGTPEGTTQGNALKNILTRLSAAKNSSETKKSSEVKPKEDDEKKKQQEKEDEAAKNNAAEKLKAAKMASQKEPKKDTKPAILAAIRSELQQKTVSSIKELPGELQDRISSYNEANKDQITDEDVIDILQDIYDAQIKDDNSVDNDEGSDEDAVQTPGDNTRSASMSANISENFSNDYVSQYAISPGVPFDYRIPYNPEGKVNSEQIEAIIKLLIELGAYEFVDRNFLGYAFQDNPELPIYFLKAGNKIEGVNPKKAGDLPITFLAVKWSDVAKAIAEHALDGKPNFGNLIHKETINGEDYVVIGTLTYKQNATDDVKNAFNNLLEQIHQDTLGNDEVDKDVRFIVWDKTSTISQIHTGRLEKKDELNDNKGKVSLYDFVATNQETPDNPESQQRRASVEWENDMPFEFGVNVGGSMNTRESRERQDPNPKIMETDNGGVYLFVPKPDGTMYPIRCTRRKVKDWFKQKADSSQTGEDMLEKVLDENTPQRQKNKYISNIVEYLRTLLDEEASFAERMEAKSKLSKYFIFGGTSPIHVDIVNHVVSLRLTRAMNEPINGTTVEDQIRDFFRILGDNNIKFTLPAPETEEGQRLSGRDVIMSGIMEVGLRGFYNFNASFTIVPIDREGNPINSTSQPNININQPNIRPNEEKLVFDDSEKSTKYLIDKDDDGNVTGIRYADGTEVTDTDEQNLVSQVFTIYKTGKRGDQNSVSSRFTADYGYTVADTEDAKAYKRGAMEPKYGNIFLIQIGEDTWVYNKGEGNQANKLYKLDSKKDKDVNNGKGLISAFRQDMNDWTENHSDEIRRLNQKKAAEQKKDDIIQQAAQQNDNQDDTPNNNTPESPAPQGGTTSYFVNKYKDQQPDGTIAGRVKDAQNRKLYNMLADYEAAGGTITESIIDQALQEDWSVDKTKDELNKCSTKKI